MNLWTKVRDKIRGLASRPFGYVAAEWERMGPRERTWVAGLSAGVIAVATMLSAYLVFSTIDELKEGNADIREALTAIAKHRNDYLEAKARTEAQETRLGSEPPQLIADIENAAREESVQISETNGRPPVAAGKRWTQHDVDLQIRSVDLQAITKFLRRVETGPRPIFVTRLSLKRRFSENDKLDAEVTATAFERVKEGAKRKGEKADRPDTLGEKASPSP